MDALFDKESGDNGNITLTAHFPLPRTMEQIIVAWLEDVYEDDDWKWCIITSKEGFISKIIVWGGESDYETVKCEDSDTE